MRSIWQSLAWKEWHEHKWRLASLAFIVCMLATLAQLSSDNPHDAVGAMIILPLIALGPLAIFVGAGDAAGERSRGTLAFLQALPVPLWRVALHKLGWGLVTVVVPGLCLGGVMAAIIWIRTTLWNDRFPSIWETNTQHSFLTTGNRLADGAFGLTLVAISLYLWTVTAGARRADEVSAAAWGLGWMTALWGMLLGLGTLLVLLVGNAEIRSFPSWDWLTALATGCAPLGFVMVENYREPGPTKLLVATQILLHVCLTVAFVRRFSLPLNMAGRSPEAASRVRGTQDWIRAPFASPWRAIAWKQLRESRPVALTGLAGVCGLACIFAVNWWLQRHINDAWQAQNFLEMCASATMAIGVFIALVAGIGVALNDMGTQLNFFWRSRPVNPHVWYWTKVVTGLLLLATTLYLPLLLLALALRPEAILTALNNEVAMLPVMHLALFATSLMMTCLVRQAIYAAVLSIGAIYLCMLPADLLRRQIAPASENAFMVGSLLVIAAIALLIGWLATRYDWGRRPS